MRFGVRTQRHMFVAAVVALGGIAVALLAADRAAQARDEARRPPVVQHPIPFGSERKRQMRRYARRHYGIDSYRLTGPKVIVEHFTASRSFQSAYDTFASNARDVELHERPGVCAHFLIARDGTIHQLVSLSLMCRHTIGLNWTSIGIEHVGVSDSDVMGNRRQLAASLRLTRWLQQRLGIRTRNVIGHAESLSSPYHHERVRALAKRTHELLALGSRAPRLARLGAAVAERVLGERPPVPVRGWRRASANWPSTPRPIGRAPARRPVALMADTFTRFLEPGIGDAAVRVLEAAGARVRVVDPGCCGRPLLSQGLVAAARRRAS